MSTLLFVEILRERGIQAQMVLTPVKCCALTIALAAPRPDIAAVAETDPAAADARVWRKALVVTRSFIGSEAKGRHHHLGRGGSDYTAALLGEALNATRVDIWTDVPGIMRPTRASRQRETHRRHRL